MLHILAFCALLSVARAQVSCPGLGDFLPLVPFTNWPDPTCPGDTGLELEYRMYNRRDRLGRDFDRNDVPFIFEPDLETIFLIHDHEDDEATNWLQDMKDALVDRNDVNTVIVAWDGLEGSEDPDYWRAASDTRTVGAETAEVMINLVVSGGGSSIRMHFMGHGLGAHVAGHAGRWARDRLYTVQRCTGLDPSGPHFINNTDRTVGIWRDCANFVDIIHTDQSIGSTPNPSGTDVWLGHQDFFPNGGLEQPGCSTNQCDHDRAVDYFMESINNNCMDATLECINSTTIPESCSACNPCPRMGYEATPGVEGRYYLTTMSDPPYC